jgi:hypothetical protein
LPDPRGEPAEIDAARGLDLDDIYGFLVEVANIFLAFLAILAVFAILVGAYQYIFSGGNDEKVKAGRNWIIYGVVGLVIAALAFVVVGFVNDIIDRAGGGTGSVGNRTQAQ